MIRFLKILFLFLAFGLLVNNSKAAYQPLLYENNTWFGNNNFLGSLNGSGSLTGAVYATSFTYATTNVGAANITITTNYVIYQGGGIGQIFTLPLAPPDATEFTINCTNTSGLTIITNSNGSQLISGQLSITNIGISSTTLFYDGVNYYSIGERLSDNGYVSGNGSLLTDLNGSQILLGTVPSARLPIGSASIFGVYQVDGVTMTAPGGVLTSSSSGLPSNPSRASQPGTMTQVLQATNLTQAWVGVSSAGRRFVAGVGFNPGAPGWFGMGDGLNVQSALDRTSQSANGTNRYTSILFTPAIVSNTNEVNMNPVPSGKSGNFIFSFYLTNATNIRTWVGIGSSSAIGVSEPTTGTVRSFVGFQCSTTNNANWVFITGNGTTYQQQTTSVAVATSPMVIEVVLNATNNNLQSVYGVINGVAYTNTTSLPNAGIEPVIALATLENAAKGIGLYEIWYEQDQ